MKHTENTRKLDELVSAIRFGTPVEQIYEVLLRQSIEMRASAYEWPASDHSEILACAESIANSAKAVGNMIGMGAQSEYDSLSWRAKRRLARAGASEKIWVNERTEARLEAARELIRQTLSD